MVGLGLREHHMNKNIDIKNLVLKGYTNKQIADMCNIKETTVKFHMTIIYKKESCKSRSQLLAKNAYELVMKNSQYETQNEELKTMITEYQNKLNKREEELNLYRSKLKELVLEDNNEKIMDLMIDGAKFRD